MSRSSLSSAVRFTATSVAASVKGSSTAAPSLPCLAGALLPAAARRSFVCASEGAALTLRAGATPSASLATPYLTLDFGGTKEVVFERSDFPRDKLLATFQNDTLAMIGYGPQGRGQALNARDQGLDIVVGVRKDGDSWKKAVADGWVSGAMTFFAGDFTEIPNKTLFSIEEACKKGTIILYLLSDAAQKSEWGMVKPHLTEGKTLCFAHGFSVVYKDQTNIVPPENID
ncbi:MAG: hypothetical protein BJ554DRAFT_6496, partial [Olpidium bornovanus]